MNDQELRELEREAATGDPGAQARLAAWRSRAGLAPPAPFRPLTGLVLILASRGAGKTLLLQKIERLARQRGSHTVVWDRLGYFQKVPGRTIVVSGDPQDAAAFAIREAPSVLFCDEIQNAFSSSSPPQKGSALYEIATAGRNPSAHGPWRRRGAVALVGAAQRAKMVHPMLRGLVDRYYLGYHPATAVEDLEWIAAACGAEVAAKLPLLPTPDDVARGIPARFEVVRAVA